MNKFRDIKPSGLEFLRVSLDLDVPLFPFWHGQKFLNHLHAAFKLLQGLLLDGVEECTHVLSTLTNRVWHSIQHTELSRKQYVHSIGANDQHRLAFVSNFELVLLEKVFCNTNFLTILQLEETRTGSVFKSDIFHNVGSARSVVADDTLINQLFFSLKLEILEPVWVFACLVFIENFLNATEHCLRRHETRAVINNERATLLLHLCAHLETFPDLHAHVSNLDRVLMVEKARSVAQLNHASLTHRF